MDFTPQNLLLIEMLADPADRRSKQEKSIAAGYSDNYVYQLLRIPEFLKALHKRTTELVAAERPRIYSNLRRDSDKGDTTATLGYLKAIGDIAPGGVNVTTSVIQSTDGRSFGDRISEATQFKRERATDSRRITVEDLD